VPAIALGMDDQPSPESAMRGEPPLIERARRVGWALLVLSVAAMAAARFGPVDYRPGAIAIAATTGLLGLLAVVNVALVRGLYRVVETAPDQGANPDDQSM
jgi:hypothetical protein